MRRVASAAFVLLLPALARPAERSATIAFTGETLGVLGWPGYPGGLPKRAQALAEIRRDQPDLLVVDAGNTLSPFYLSRLDRGATHFALLDELGYAVLNLGYHDFDFGQEHLLALERGARGLRLLSSNIRATATGAPWTQETVVRQVGGLRVGLIGLCHPDISEQAVIGHFNGLTAEAPVETLRRLVPEVRSRADVVVVVSNMDAGALEAALEAVPGVDVAISASGGVHGGPDPADPVPAYSAKVLARLGKAPASPARRTLIVYTSRYGWHLGRIDVDYSADGGTVAVRDIRASSADLSAEASEDAGVLGRVQGLMADVHARHGKTLVSGLAARAGRPWDKAAFFAGVLRAMRRASRSEAAVINDGAFFKADFVIDYQARHDEIDALQLENLFWTENHLVKTRLTGAQLAALWAKSKAAGGLRWLGVTEGPLGLRVNGRPVDPAERYSLALSNYLALGESPWPELKQGSGLEEEFGGRRRVIRYAFREALESDPDALRLEPEHPVQWRLRAERVSLNLVDFDTRTDPRYAAVPDPRVQSRDQFTVGTSGSFSATRDSEALTWRNGVEWDYARVSLPAGIVNTPRDLLALSTRLDDRRHTLPVGLGSRALPFVRLGYDTQFSPAPGIDRRRTLNASAGLMTTWNGRFRDMRLGALLRRENARPTSTRAGAELSSKFERPFGRRGLVLSQDTELRWFPRMGGDTVAQLLYSAEFRQRLLVPVVTDLYLAPFVEVFVWRGKLIPFTGSNVTWGVVLTYAHLWKPQYRTP